MASQLPEAPRSQLLFERFCADHSIVCERIVPQPDARTADYILHLPQQDVVAEVKEIRPNKSDETTLARRRTVALFDQSAGRLRSKLKKVSPQLKEASLRGVPTILVVYDFPRAGSLDSLDVKAAMYGDETYVVQRLSSGDFATVDARLGANQTCTSNQNTSLSALAILRAIGSTLLLTLYHNSHARTPLDPATLRVRDVSHFAAMRTPNSTIPEWCEL